jgi:hypothetical protein
VCVCEDAVVMMWIGVWFGRVFVSVREYGWIPAEGLTQALYCISLLASCFVCLCVNMYW